MKALAFAHRGFTLLELATSMAVITIIVVGTLSLAEFNRRVEQGKAVGKLMLLINDAVIEYKDVHRAELIKLPADCGKSSYGVGFASKQILPNCSFIATTRDPNTSITVANGMQPTIDELKTMGFLESGFKPRLSLPLDTTRSVSFYPPRFNYSYTVNEAPDNYTVLIQRECVTGTCNAQTGPFVLKSLVFNAQPYRVDQKLFGSGARLGAAVMAMGGAGYVSMVGGDGKLRSPLNQVTVENPVKEGGKLDNSKGYITGVAADHNVGTAGILAAYDGRGFPDERYTYRDGTRLPTQDWDFNNKKLTNIDELGAQTVKAKGDISAGGKMTAIGDISSDGQMTAKGDISSGSNMSASGNVTAAGNATARGNMSAGGNISAEGQISAKDNVFVGKDLDVTGDSALHANVTIEGQSAVKQVAYKISADLFSKCDTHTDSFALRKDNNHIILACQRNEWREVVVKQGARAYKLVHHVIGPIWYARIKMGYTKYDGSHYEASKEIYEKYGEWDVTVPEGITDFRVSFEKRLHGSNYWVVIWQGPLTQELYDDPDKRCLTTYFDYDDAEVLWCKSLKPAHVE